jgi:hypothetical protein
MAVLEWCKLFTDRRDKHHWSRIVSFYDAYIVRHQLEGAWQLHNLPASPEALVAYFEGEFRTASINYDRGCHRLECSS